MSTQQKTSSGMITMIHKSRKTILALLNQQGFDTTEYDNKYFVFIPKFI